jgi:group II intron reverse transcriptase/maturase
LGQAVAFEIQLATGGNGMSATRPFTIAKQKVVEAFKAAKANAGAAGVDEQSIEDFERNLKDNLYKIWNRMSSGIYFPPPVKAVAIAKKDGGERILGVPTVADRVAQMVAKMEFEPKVESIFLPDSYGYRPNKSALDAVGVTRERCWQYDWILEFDVRKLFDNIDHELLLKAVRKHTECKWVRLYVERWLKAPMQLEDGSLMQRTKGTPQGGVVSPVLSNLFLHYAFDLWMGGAFAVASTALKAMRQTTRKWNFRNRTDFSLEDISRMYNRNPARMVVLLWAILPVCDVSSVSPLQQDVGGVGTA